MNELKKLFKYRKNNTPEKKYNYDNTTKSRYCTIKTVSEVADDTFDINMIVSIRKQMKSSILFYKSALQVGSISATSQTIAAIIEDLIPLQSLISLILNKDSTVEDQLNKESGERKVSSNLSLKRNPTITKLNSPIQTRKESFKITKQMLLCCRIFLLNLQRFINQNDYLLLNELIIINISNEIGGPTKTLISDKKFNEESSKKIADTLLNSFNSFCHSLVLGKNFKSVDNINFKSDAIANEQISEHADSGFEGSIIPNYCMSTYVKSDNIMSECNLNKEMNNSPDDIPNKMVVSKTSCYESNINMDYAERISFFPSNTLYGLKKDISILQLIQCSSSDIKRYKELIDSIDNMTSPDVSQQHLQYRYQKTSTLSFNETLLNVKANCTLKRSYSTPIIKHKQPTELSINELVELNKFNLLIEKRFNHTLNALETECGFSKNQITANLEDVKMDISTSSFVSDISSQQKNIDEFLYHKFFSENYIIESGSPNSLIILAIQCCSNNDFSSVTFLKSFILSYKSFISFDKLLKFLVIRAEHYGLGEDMINNIASSYRKSACCLQNSSKIEGLHNNPDKINLKLVSKSFQACRLIICITDNLNEPIKWNLLIRLIKLSYSLMIVGQLSLATKIYKNIVNDHLSIKLLNSKSASTLNISTVPQLMSSNTWCRQIKFYCRQATNFDRIMTCSNTNNLTTVHEYVYSKLASILDIESLKLAQQITYLHELYFVNVTETELISWAIKQDVIECPNLTQFIDNFNCISYWIRSVILCTNKQADRLKLFNKFTKAMQHLVEMQNFSCLFAFVSALNSSPVRRLSFPKQSIEAFDKIALIIDNASSYANYRSVLTSSEPPCIPYVGIALQDLTFIHIGNHDFIPPRKQLKDSDDHFQTENSNIVNAKKMFLKYSTIEQHFGKFFKTRYNFSFDQEVHAVLEGFRHHLNDDELWETSLKICPKTN